MTLALGWVDIGLLAFLSISVLVGLLRGFVFELLSLAGWFAAWLAATQWAGWAERYVPAGEPGSALKHGVAFACVFLSVVVMWGLAARLVRSLIRATPLSPFDRVLGAAFGLLRGMVEQCNTELNLALFPDEVTSIAAVLNRDHYRFK